MRNVLLYNGIFFASDEGNSEPLISQTMQKLKQNQVLLLIAAILLSATASAQVDAGVKVTPGQQQGQMLDSVRNTPYPYTFPLLGKRVAGRGFLLPYPIGVMLNLYRGSQDVNISDLGVGVNDEPMVSLDEMVKFGEVQAKVSNVNMRADLWLLPFLDLYGIFGKAWVETQVNMNSIAGHPVDISTTAKFDGYVYGAGGMLTGGVRSVFFSADYNMVWTHFDAMTTNNRVSNFSLRTGYIFHLKRGDNNLAVWSGAGRAFMSSKTVGEIKLSDVAPDMGEDYRSKDWYADLSPAMQHMTDQVVENFVDKHKGDVIHYTLKKRPTHNWSMIAGAQYQANRRWQLRTEVNFLGGRRSGLISANYRFGIK